MSSGRRLCRYWPADSNRGGRIARASASFSRSGDRRPSARRRVPKSRAPVRPPRRCRTTRSPKTFSVPRTLIRPCSSRRRWCSSSSGTCGLVCAAPWPSRPPVRWARRAACCWSPRIRTTNACFSGPPRGGWRKWTAFGCTWCAYPSVTSTTPTPYDATVRTLFTFDRRDTFYRWLRRQRLAAKVRTVRQLQDTGHRGGQCLVVQVSQCWGVCVIMIPSLRLPLSPFRFRNTLFPDNPNVNWDTISLSNKIAEHVEQLEIDTVLTFDSYGISGHRNHVSIYLAMSHLVYNKLLPDCELYVST